MKYETPEVTALTAAINAVQSSKTMLPNQDGMSDNIVAYEDWE